MISKNKLKFLKSLQIKKNRKEAGLFVVEGEKSVAELLQSDYTIDSLFITEAFLKAYSKPIEKRNLPYIITTEDELGKAGSFATNDAAIAIAGVKENIPLHLQKNEFGIILDNIKDPGNLGTIIRIADWYGITKIICSEETAEVYNPKVIASSMGSFTRIQVYYCDLGKYIHELKDVPVYGATLTGENIHLCSFKAPAFIMVGNESNGIRPEYKKILHSEISISRFGHAESLNAATATAVICDRLRNP
ncbi:MAG TPA: RNA methyltransferase [Cytophagaceae bacterium]|jgi:TrmH family RNA methyltransferase|nr:RNA methyltransferase [Cytophagaceae bacterium]